MKNKKGYVLTDKLSNEIIDLEKTINGLEKVNKRNTRIKNIKVFGHFIRLILPIIASVGVALGAMLFFGDVPFYPQDVEKIGHYEETFDNKGETRIDKKYMTEKIQSSYVEYYSKWQLKEDNKYYRNHNIYYFDSRNVALDKAKGAVTIDGVNMDSIFGKPESSKLEVKNDLSEEDINNDGYIKVVYSYKDFNDRIIEGQDWMDNILLTMLFFCLIGMNFVIFIHIDELTNYDYEKCIEVINHDYQLIDIIDLKKELGAKKSEYCKRLYKELKG